MIVRMVNMHTAPIDNGRTGKHAAIIARNAVGEFDDENASIKKWIRAGWLVTEAAMLASKANAVDAPSIAEMHAMRDRIAALEAELSDAHVTVNTHVANADRVAASVNEAAAKVAALEAENADLKATLAAATAPAPEAPARGGRK